MITLRRHLAGPLAALCLALPSLAAAQQANEPKTAADWTTTYGRRTDAVWNGSDQGNSIRASNGLVYFVHGDTFTSREILDPGVFCGCYEGGATGTKFVNNSIVRLVGSGTSTMVAPATSSTEAIPPILTPDGKDVATRLWAMDLFQANGNYLYVLTQALAKDLKSNKGAYLQKFAINANGTLTRTGRLIPLPGAGTTQTGEGPSTVQWSRAAVNFFGTVILYGDANKGANPSKHEAYVLRIPEAKLDTLDANDYAAVEFWNGTYGWLAGKSNQANATPILNQMVDSVRVVNGKWLVSYKEYEGFKNNPVIIKKGPNEHSFDTVHATIAANAYPLVSGYHSATRCGTSPAYPNVQYIAYAPTMHPEISLTSSSRMLMSIAWNVANETQFWWNAELYRLRFFDVPRP